MTEHQIKITNPMTIIAIFATISETSAAVSLPFLDGEDREIYIWFLISFPFYLLFLFFYTLNFNYKSLYAPSDFQKSKQFLKVIDDTARSEMNRDDHLAKTDEQSLQPPTRKEHAERSKKRRRRALLKARSDYLLQSMQDPPDIAARDNLSVQHQISLPKSIQNIRIMDARWIHKKKEFRHLVSEVNKSKHPQHKAIIFLSCHESAHIVNEVSLKAPDIKSDPTNNFYIVYNLSTLSVTVIDQNSNPPDYPNQEKSLQINAREKEDRGISDH
ncbi:MULTISPECIES: hypothetical protein [unclassified Pseudomonas]|uniref:hypothetical protein n=1 Tax=unclassified Pseudomonas TaxID=196821 RepID=UPI002115AF67|nr:MULTISPECIES: hypothetical protein [unclassified Pseudomonas]